jgi:DNA-binding LacI/PurR family transcriptional regulator
VRQPLRKMGEISAETVLRRIADPQNGPHPNVITVEPELIVRASTASAPARLKTR